MHSDAEQRINGSLWVMELNLEIDREVISRVKQLPLLLLLDANISTHNGRWEIEKYKLLLKYLNEAREIGRLTRRGGGNTMIVFPKALLLEQIGSFCSTKLHKHIDVNNPGISTQIGYI